MYEHYKQPVIPFRAFLKRLLRHIGVAAAIILFSLGIGILGYRILGGLSWVDSLLNASMILGGMGPVNPLSGNGAKIFASVYALYSGMILLVTVGVLLAPVVHRLLHHFHADAETRH
jgi:hypothetical protein